MPMSATAMNTQRSVSRQAETRALHDKLRAERRTFGAAHTDAAPVLNVASEFDALGIDFSLPSKPSIILMPIKDLSADGAHGHLAAGLRIDMQSALVKISGLFVIAAGSAAIYNDRGVRPEQVSQEMGVRHVLECSIQGNAGQIRITAQLSDGISGQIVWSERYDRKLDGDFLIQDEIVERIVTSLDVKLVGGEQARVWRKTLRDPKALELYYKGLELLGTFDKQSVALARTLFERVANIAPDVTLGPTCVAFCQ
jgi:TolB-like protein